MASVTKPQTTEKEKVLTCITCRLTFPDPELMRTHYKGELHRFNLKRRVAQLPPVTEAVFKQKMTAIEKEKDAAPVRGVGHIKKESKRAVTEHKEEDAKTSAPSSSLPTAPATAEKKTEPLSTKEGKDEDEDDEETKTEDQLIDEKIAASKKLSLKDSLFDGHRSRSFAANMRYMTKTYGFFIPELEFLKDIKALVGYLGQKVSVGNACLFCHKSFISTEAVQNHMRDASHCMILWEDNEDEYAQFYDWTNDVRRAPIGEEEGNEVAYVSEHNELVLVDSGKTLGHRSMRVYYEQRPRVHSHQQLVTSLMQEHRRLQALSEQKSKQRDRYTLQAHADFMLKTGLANNNQKHYRNSNPL